MGKAVARHAAQKGSVSVFNFTSPRDRSNSLAVVSAGSEWSQDGPALENFIDDIFVLGGQTTLLDAIDTIAKDLNAKVNLEKGVMTNGVIVLITDGEDRQSRIREDDLIKELKKTGVKVYALGLVSELDSQGGLIKTKSTKDRAMDLLKKITKETGGRAIFPELRKLDPDKLMNQLFAEPAP